MADQVGHILAGLGIPHFQLVLHETTRQKARGINRIKAYRAHYCLVTNQLELLDVHSGVSLGI